MATVPFFAPSDVFGMGADWALQSGANPAVSRQRAQALGADGDEIAYAQYGEQTAVTCTYKAKKTTGNLTVPKVGKVVGGHHVDSVQVAYSQTDFPTLTITGHAHGGSHDACRTYTCPVTFPARAIGVPAMTGVFACPAGLGMRSLTVAMQCQHVDENDSSGEHLAGDNYDGAATVTVEFTGDCTVAECNIGNGWGLPESFGKSQSNTAATTTSLTLTRHVAHDPPSQSNG